jgi:hypothetical protein
MLSAAGLSPKAGGFFYAMTEREYINVRELSQVIDAIKILSCIVPDNSEVISGVKYRSVMEIIYTWQEKLYKKCKVK